MADRSACFHTFHAKIPPLVETRQDFIIIRTGYAIQGNFCK